MDSQRAAKRTRQISPGRPAWNGDADDRRARSPRSAPYENDRVGARNGRRGFGDRMRELTGRVPVMRRVTGYRRPQTRVDREWDAMEDARYDDGFRSQRGQDNMSGPPPLDSFDGPPGLAADGFGGGNGQGGRARGGGGGGKNGRGKGSRIPLRQRNFSIRLVTVLALLSVIVGFCCTQSTLWMVDVASAAVDAKAQVNALQAIAKGGNVTDTEHLTEVQTRLVALNGDLVRLQSALPSPLASTSAGVNLQRTLSMSLKLVQAGRYGIDAALILVPHLKGALKDVGGGASATPSAGTTPGTTAAATATSAPAPTPTETTAPANTSTGGLTMDDVTRAQQDIAAAGTLAQQALAERQYINDGQLSKVGLGSIVSILHKMDGIAPKLPTYLGYANKVTAALPDLLGITKPAHFLLFNVDTDERRSTGGFMGNYAVVTVQGGKLIGGIHLSDTAAFDCNGPQTNCLDYPIPTQYQWMNADPTQFGMRDSNLSPDFPTSAKLIISMYQMEMARWHPGKDASIDGVFMITPDIIKDILKLTGPLTVPGFKDPANSSKLMEVTPSNLLDVIHYFHILNRIQTGGGNQNQKAIDGLLGSALFHKVGSLSAAEQSVLMKEIIEAIGTKDVQMYFTDERVESVLSELHMDSAVPMPAGTDGLMVTDVNVGATYFSRDMEESVVDKITFDSQGNAIHDMTMTYKLPSIMHLYTPIYLDSHNPITWYSGLMRVLVPEGSTPIGGSTAYPDLTQSAVQIQTCTIVNPQFGGCVPTSAGEPGYKVWGLRLNAMQVGKDTVIVHMKWTSPKVLQNVNGQLEYKLVVYRQAGSHISYDITIVPPSKHQIAQPLALPLKTLAKMSAGAAAEFTTPTMIKDNTLTVTFTGG